MGGFLVGNNFSGGRGLVAGIVKLCITNYKIQKYKYIKNTQYTKYTIYMKYKDIQNI